MTKRKKPLQDHDDTSGLIAALDDESDMTANGPRRIRRAARRKPLEGVDDQTSTKSL